MPHHESGALLGLAFGVVTLALMWPMTFPDRKAALAAAFIERCAIGIVIGCVQVALPGWLVGASFGFLLSLPSAIITRAYVPIVAIGTAGGLVIGGLVHGWS